MIKTLVTLLVLASAQASGVATAPAQIVGTWLSEEKDAKVEIYPCETKFCGKITWLEVPNDPKTGKPVLDYENSDESKRSRPRLGMVMMEGFTWDADDHEWNHGKVYDARNGKLYSGKAWLDDADHLKLRGYIGISLLGRSTLMSRLKP